MGIRERREIEKEVFKKKIFDATSEILIKEGYANLSIRKIAKAIEYSPGSIYHYFSSKSEIISMIYDENVKKISERLSEIPIDREKPEVTLVSVIKLFIALTLEAPDHYRAVIMNDIEEIQQKAGMLGENDTVQSLCSLIDLGVNLGRFKNIEVELTAQMIWVYTHGVISRLILEKNLSEARKEKIIAHHCEMMKQLLLANK